MNCHATRQASTARPETLASTPDVTVCRRRKSFDDGRKPTLFEVGFTRYKIDNRQTAPSTHHPRPSPPRVSTTLPRLRLRPVPRPGPRTRLRPQHPVDRRPAQPRRPRDRRHPRPLALHPPHRRLLLCRHLQPTALRRAAPHACPPPAPPPGRPRSARPAPPSRTPPRSPARWPSAARPASPGPGPPCRLTRSTPRPSRSSNSAVSPLAVRPRRSSRQTTTPVDLAGVRRRPGGG